MPSGVTDRTIRVLCTHRAAGGRYRTLSRVRVRPFAVSMPSPSSNRAAPTRVQDNASRSPTSASGLRKVPPPHTAVDASHKRACVQHAQDAPQDDCSSKMDCKTLRPLEFEAAPRNRCDVGSAPSSPAKRRKRTKTSRLTAGAACCVRAPRRDTREGNDQNYLRHAMTRVVLVE